MERINKKYYISMILFISSILLNGCNRNSEEINKAKELERNKTKEEIEKEYKEDAAEMVDTYYRKITVLLSFKYAIPEETMKQLLIDYIKNENLLWLFSEEEQPINNYITVLEKLSIQHNIPKAKLGSIIIDYKLLKLEMYF